jgi:hypothetical protein
MNDTITPLPTMTRFVKFAEKHEKRLWATGPALALITVLIDTISTKYYYNILDESSISNAILWAILAYLIGEGVSQKAGAELEERRRVTMANQLTESVNSRLSTHDASLNESITRLKSLVRPNPTVTKLTGESTTAVMTAAFESAHSVINTWVNLSRKPSATQDPDRVLEYYRAVLKKPSSSWHDIVGVSEFTAERFNQLQNSSPKLRGNHQIDVIGTHTPIINFSLCARKDSHFSDVFFGWVRKSANELNVDIFHSRDKDIIGMFESYFSLLKAYPTRIIDSISANHSISADYTRNSKIFNLIGNWISIDGEARTLDHIEPGIFSSRRKDHLTFYTDLKIEYKDEWVITGTCYSYPERALKHTLTSDSCVILDDAIYYRYIIKEDGKTPISGIGIYELSNEDDKMIGYYVRNRSEKSQILRAVKSKTGVSLDESLSQAVQIKWD